MHPFFMDPAEVERRQAAHNSATHDVNRLWDELTEDQLRAVEFMLDGIATDDQPVRIASYFAGRVSAFMQQRFRICSACGRDHDADLADLATDECPTCGSKDPRMHPATQAEGEVTHICPDPYHKPGEVKLPHHVKIRRRLDESPEVVDKTLAEPDKSYTVIGSIGALQPWEQVLCDDYGIDDLRDEDTNQLRGFICLNCKRGYPTIEERLNFEPKTDGCVGCHLKAAHG